MKEQSILNVTVSLFSSYRDTKPTNINLYDWLFLNKFNKEVEKIRNSQDEDEIKKLKSSLPAITPSGIFEKRKANKLINHSGFIQFDIDLKDNTHVKNFNELKDQLSKINEIAYCGLSVSGKGFWGLVPIMDPKKHKQHFEALYIAFKSLGIIIDKSCKDVCRLRGYSIDPNAYFNHFATTFTKVSKPLRNKSISELNSISFNNKNQNIVRKNFLLALYIIQQYNIDITGGYEHWFSIGCSIANEFKEAGRDYFHIISSKSSKYNFSDADRQYNHCLKNSYNYGIGTFFYYCRLNGVIY